MNENYNREKRKFFITFVKTYENSMTQNKLSLPLILEDEGCLPVYSSSLAAGADLKAYIREPMLLSPGESLMVPTGIRMAIPEGYEVQIRPRSGLAAKFGITVLNTPGTIDADYRGEILVILINHGKKDFEITPGMRIAQMVLVPVIQAEFCLSQELAETTRGSGGFGHTGTH